MIGTAVVIKETRKRWHWSSGSQSPAVWSLSRVKCVSVSVDVHHLIAG